MSLFTTPTHWTVATHRDRMDNIKAKRKCLRDSYINSIRSPPRIPQSPSLVPMEFEIETPEDINFLIPKPPRPATPPTFDSKMDELIAKFVKLHL